MNNYYNWPEFESIYLEDSFVKGISEYNDRLTFSLEIVLKDNHPRYELPKKGERYCYKNGEIVFSEIDKIIWIEKNMHQYKDANNEIDYGNIDELSYSEESEEYKVTGDWGHLRIKCETLSVNLME